MSQNKMKTWVFYFIQGEKGEGSSHPNAFRIAHSKSYQLCLKDIQEKLPLQHSDFHMRFRLNHPQGETYFWLDILDPKQVVPIMSNDRVICKLIRLNKVPKVGIFLKQKQMVLKSKSERADYHDESSSRSAAPIQKITQKEDQLHRSSPKPTSNHRRATPYSDTSTRDNRNEKIQDAAKNEQPPPNSTRASPEHVNNKKEKEISVNEKKTELKKTDSLEDFFSGGASPSNNVKKKSIDLMNGNWDESNSQNQNNAKDYMSNMDPLITSKASSRPLNSQGQASNQINSFQEGGQTVGPVTLAEMEKVGTSSTNDGSNVYNPDNVDKTSKSSKVRKAMEKRENEKNESIQRARDDVRKRDENIKQVDQEKQKAIQMLGPKLKLWAEDNGRKKNIRTLISTMHHVMWEGSKWPETSIAKLLNPNEVKKSYRRAMLVVHPDKNSGRTPEQLVIAERVFDAINSAWDDFSRTEMG